MKLSESFLLMNALSDVLLEGLESIGFVADFATAEPFSNWIESVVREQFQAVCEVLEIDEIENDID